MTSTFLGHYEHPPYDEGSKRSVYHIRNLEVFRLKQVRKTTEYNYVYELAFPLIGCCVLQNCIGNAA